MAGQTLINIHRTLLPLHLCGDDVAASGAGEGANIGPVIRPIRPVMNLAEVAASLSQVVTRPGAALLAAVVTGRALPGDRVLKRGGGVGALLHTGSLVQYVLA